MKDKIILEVENDLIVVKLGSKPYQKYEFSWSGVWLSIDNTCKFTNDENILNDLREQEEKLKETKPELFI